MRTTLSKIEPSVESKNCHGSYAIAHGLLGGNIPIGLNLMKTNRNCGNLLYVFL